MNQLINAEPQLSTLKAHLAAEAETEAGMAADISVAPFRWVLRQATQDVHQRLHRHDGFAAIQNTTIDIASYRRLLVRLYGFYVPFEAAADIGCDRSAWLEDDLRALGVDQRGFGTTPMCNDIPCLKSADARLGALYVIEGSALGGRDLSRNLDQLLGPEAINGRRFFLGRGHGTGEAWRRYLAQLSTSSAEPEARSKITRAALETFAVFEKWLSGWSAATNG